MEQEINKIKHLLGVVANLEREGVHVHDTLIRASKRKEEIVESSRKLKDEIIKLLEAVDVASRGNMGWENRIIRFLIGVTAQPEPKPQAVPVEVFRPTTPEDMPVKA